MRKKQISWDKFFKDVKEARKDPEFMKALKEFIRYHTGKSPR